MTKIDLSVMTFDAAKALFVEIRAAQDNWQELVIRAHDGKAWAAIGYNSWAECVRQEFPISKRHANRLIQYGKVYEVLADVSGTIGPLLESHARELAPLEPEAQRATFAAAAAAAVSAGERLTARHIRAAAKAKRNGTAAAAQPEPLPHAPGTISDAELDVADKGDPVWLSTFHFRDCDEAQQIKAAGLFFNDMKLTNQVLVTALYMSALSPDQLRELGKRIDFGALMEASK